MDWSVIGIILSLAFIVVLALRGWHIIIIAPLAVVIVSIFSDMNIMQTMTGPYMKGFSSPSLPRRNVGITGTSCSPTLFILPCHVHPHRLRLTKTRGGGIHEEA
jgi:hypothetical protein